MNITDAVTFLAGSILVSVGLAMIGLMILIMNNLFSKYWKPVKVFVYENRPYKIEEIFEPTIDQDPIQKK
jgi:hypothetical protein